MSGLRTLINLHPNEQEFHYYSFSVKLERCVGSCNTINDLSNKACVPNKSEDLNISFFNMIAGINESETSKHISCECKCKFDKTKLIQINCGITINVDVNVKSMILICEKEYVWNPAACNCENGKYLVILWMIQRLSVMKLWNHAMKK